MINPESIDRNEDERTLLIANTKTIVLDMIGQADITSSLPPGVDAQGIAQSIAGFIVDVSKYPAFKGALLAHDGNVFNILEVRTKERGSLRTRKLSITLRSRLNRAGIHIMPISDSAEGFLGFSPEEVVGNFIRNAIFLGKLDPIR